jgi:hypothetical protein
MNVLPHSFGLIAYRPAASNFFWEQSEQNLSDGRRQRSNSLYIWSASSNMVPPGKRRKLSRHTDEALSFEDSVLSEGWTTGSFVLQTKVLVQETKLDYETTLKDVDGQLRMIKDTIDSIELSESLPVCNELFFSSTTEWFHIYADHR